MQTAFERLVRAFARIEIIVIDGQIVFNAVLQRLIALPVKDRINGDRRVPDAGHFQRLPCSHFNLQDPESQNQTPCPGKRIPKWSDLGCLTERGKIVSSYLRNTEN